MKAKDLFNHLKNAGFNAVLEGDELTIPSSCTIKPIPGNRWLIGYPDGVGEVYGDDDILDGLRDVYRGDQFPIGVQLVVRRLVWYFKHDDSFTMRPWKEIVEDEHPIINIGSYNGTMLSYINNQVHGINAETGKTVILNSVEDVLNEC